MQDLGIKPWGQVPDYAPDDIQLALQGYGPEEFQEEVQAFVGKYGQQLTASALCRILGLDYSQLPERSYGQYSTQAIVVLRPQADLMADIAKFQAGVI